MFASAPDHGASRASEYRRRLYETSIQGGVELSYARKPKVPDQGSAMRVCSCLCGFLTSRVDESFWLEAPDRPGEYLCRPCHGRCKSSSVLCCNCWTETRHFVVAHDVASDVYVCVSTESPPRLTLQRCRDCLSAVRKQIQLSMGFTCEGLTCGQRTLRV